MTIRTYYDFILEAGDVALDARGNQAFTVAVTHSPLGQTQPEPRSVFSGLLRRLGQLERRRLDIEEIVDIGEGLADSLLGGAAGALFDRCLAQALGPEQGLRLRLHLPPELAAIPWEYLYRQRGGGEKDTTGFLALDPRVSVVRQETQARHAPLDTAPSVRRMLVALASPVDSDRLDLAGERENIERAFRNSPTSIQLDFLEDATPEGLAQRLREDVEILHFAGHGTFDETELGLIRGSALGEGAILLVNGTGESAPMPADQLAVNLLGSGVQLVILGACETGKRDREHVWSGVVAAVLEAQVPAAVAMQFSVWDEAAITFARNFYPILAAGLPLDYAVVEARRAVFNLCHANRGHVKRSRYWRDWGVPVLYVQVDGNFALPSLTLAARRNAVEHYYRGRDAMYRRQYDLALTYYRQAARAAPGYSDAYEGIVFIQQSQAMNDINQREYDSAAIRLAEALEAADHTDPEDAQALALVGSVHKALAQVAQGRGDDRSAAEANRQAASFFERALEIDPDLASAYIGLGNVQHLLGHLDGAIEAYTRAVELEPRAAAAYHDKAIACEGKAAEDPFHAVEWRRKALDAWRQAYQLAPYDPLFPEDYHIRKIYPQITRLESLLG